MSSKFRVAFIGLDNPHGAGWRDLVANLQDEIEIVALVPGYQGATTSLEEQYAGLPRFENVEQLLDGAEFDGAMVCLPNDVGPATIVRLAAAGKHVMAEKPVAGSAVDGQQIVAAVQKAGISFQTGYNWRYDRGANRIKDMIDDGRFGKLISLEMNFVTSDVNRRGKSHYLFDKPTSTGGFFNWLACHFLDLLLYVTSQQVVGVTARTGQFGATDVDVEDGGVAILDLANGALASFTGGYWVPRWAGESHWCIRGSERWVHWDPAASGTGGVLQVHGPQPQWYAMEETFTIPADDTPGYGGCNGVALLQDWLETARGNQDHCRNTVESMQAVLQLIDTIYQASTEERRMACEIG